MMAIDSHTVMAPSTSAGTLPVGDTGSTVERKASVYSGACTSSNGMPKWVSTSHGRCDQEE